MRIIFYLLCAAMGALANAAPMKLVITVSDSNGGSFGANIVFDAEEAFEFGPEISSTPLATFDLGSSEWTDGESGQRVTLIQAREWAETSKTTALASMVRLTDADQRAFLQELLAPSFEVSESTTGLHLKSRFLSYTASEPLALGSDMMKLIFVYDELNAFRKAMVIRQTPPFTQLEVTRVLREKGIFPGLLTAEITTPNGSVRVVTRFKLVELTPEEQATLKKIDV